MSSLRISAILLAAGLSTRMGVDKLLLKYQGMTMLQRAVDLLAALPVFEKILVTTEARLESATIPHDVVAIVNPYPESGQSGSVRLGVAAASGGWFLFLAADQPGLTTADLHRLIDAAEKNEGKIIYPVIDGSPGTPVIFPSKFRDELISLSGDVGGRVVRERHHEACVPVMPEHPERFFDIDDMDELQRANAVPPLQEPGTSSG